MNETVQTTAEFLNLHNLLKFLGDQTSHLNYSPLYCKFCFVCMLSEHDLFIEPTAAVCMI